MHRPAQHHECHEHHQSISARLFAKTSHIFSCQVHKPGCAHLMAIFILLIWFFPAMADEVRVAVAANFTAPMQKIAPSFERTTGHKLILSFGSTGKFYAQIRNGAPFDVLLSADESTPAKLEAEGNAVAGSRFTYAVGKLVLWSPKPGMVDKSGKVLILGEFRHLALANPKLAPYGAASVEAMKALGVYQKLKDKFVLGENLPQVHQFVASGNAELGFLSLSQIFQNGKYSEGSFWLLPENLYPPVKQDAVTLSLGKNKPAVDVFMKYLRGKESMAIIKSYGYGI